MKKNYIFILVILLFSCRNTQKKETLCFLYKGNLKPTIQVMVLKNSPNSFVDSSNFIGPPVEYIVSHKDFNKMLKIKDFSNYQFNDKDNKTGIMIIHYIEKVPTGKIIFSNKVEVDGLINYVYENLSDNELQKNIVEWIKIVQYVHKTKVGPATSTTLPAR